MNPESEVVLADDCVLWYLREGKRIRPFDAASLKPMFGVNRWAIGLFLMGLKP